MSQSKNNVVTHGLSGMVGGMLVFKQVNGKTVVAQRPRKSNAVPNAGQLKRQQKFKEAAIYAKSAVQNPLYKTLYQSLAGNGKTAYNIAFADYFKPPVLSKANTSAYTGLAGQTLTVQALDDVKVEAVSIEIKQVDGTILESGAAALLPNGLDWQYQTTAVNATIAGTIITFIATDIPGNSSTLEVELE
ncbi:hypothetical protein BCY91_12125 [Pelobium manganitolerans]|uniref:Uncharacterized protein n=1 Tax=Pelobium manganitolerans TaxID=1842495 RepID=A0A419S1N6_9SPHI|nr:hypothetical protein [Pelobium manganitolerans]RKD12390.1 hypothetical protein BCY91_12125 [Pelobium manganitolerans]